MNLSTHTKNLVHCGNTEQAHQFISSIRGVGTKIASFYLRDISFLANIDEKVVKHVHLLQPMDTWLEQTAQIIFGKNTSKKTTKDKQKQIVKLLHKRKIAHGIVNIAIVMRKDVGNIQTIQLV